MKKQKILVVDDSALNRALLSEMLSDNYKICEAQNGQEAVELLADHWREYSLVLLDINMPVMDGYEVLRYMKAHNWLEALPVIAISAETREDNIGLAYELGVSDYFKRPFDISAVRRRVRNTIALYDKISGNLQDAVGMLSAFFSADPEDQSDNGFLLGAEKQRKRRGRKVLTALKSFRSG